LTQRGHAIPGQETPAAPNSPQQLNQCINKWHFSTVQAVATSETTSIDETNLTGFGHSPVRLCDSLTTDQA
jgi:hypothetical protein